MMHRARPLCIQVIGPSSERDEGLTGFNPCPLAPAREDKKRVSPACVTIKTRRELSASTACEVVAFAAVATARLRRKARKTNKVATGPPAPWVEEDPPSPTLPTNGHNSISISESSPSPNPSGCMFENVNTCTFERARTFFRFVFP